MAMKRSSLTPLFIASGVAGLALSALVGSQNAQAQSVPQILPKRVTADDFSAADKQKAREELLRKGMEALKQKPDAGDLGGAPQQEIDELAMPAKPQEARREVSQVLLGSFNKFTRNNAELSEYSALIETADKKLVICSGLKVVDRSFQSEKPVDQAKILVTSPTVADLLRPAPQSSEPQLQTAQTAKQQNVPHSFGSCMPYRVNLSENILGALRRGDPGPLQDYMGDAVGERVGVAVVDAKDGVLVSSWLVYYTDPSKRVAGFELPNPVTPPTFADESQRREYIRLLQDQPPYTVEGNKSCPNTGYNDALARDLDYWERRTTAPIKLRGCNPI